ncbi:MAG: transglycosylase SLT domain-containing protein [Candidatus Protistobacter heckmanni]|nr:transglycosylase SLT domain-containing protein [Candidatus Protistobacter heckmanni]
MNVIPSPLPAPLDTPHSSLNFRRIRLGAAIAACAALALLAGCAGMTPISGQPGQAPQAQGAQPAGQAAADAPKYALPEPGGAALKAVKRPPSGQPAAAGTDIAGNPLTIDVDNQSVFALKGSDKDLWARIRRGFAMPDLSGLLVEDRTQWYANRPDYVARMVNRSSRYLFHIVEEIERRNMPTELALLPFVESAFNPEALSHAKAAGMWQFIPSTGRNFNLKQNMFRDERRDVLASTNAALDYLQKLYNMFGDWHLALAAYNWGEGSVSRAIARNQRQGLPTDYASLNMPNETRNYVPKLQAVKNLIANPDAFALKLPEIDNNPYFVTVTTGRDIDVELAARLAGMPLTEFKALNPSFTRPVIIGATHPQILLPFENAEKFETNLARYEKPLASWTAMRVSSRESVEAVAARIGVSAATLREVNSIPKGMRLRSGSTLLVPRGRKATEDISVLVADNAQLSIEPDVPDTRRVTVRTRKGGTVSKIAARYGVSAEKLRAWNKLTGEALAPGKTLTLFVPNKKGGKAKTHHKRRALS